MAMNDEETVALLPVDILLVKAHGAADPDKYVGREPAGASIEEQGLGWKNTYGSGVMEMMKIPLPVVLEGAWTPTPTEWNDEYFDVLLGYDWELTKSPAGAHQWTARNMQPLECTKEHPHAQVDPSNYTGAYDDYCRYGLKNGSHLCTDFKAFS